MAANDGRQVIPTSIVSAAGKTRLGAALDRAAAGGYPAVGQWMEFPGYSLARAVASLGCDWVLIDCEHGNFDDGEMYHAVGAVATAGASPVVRVASAEHWLIKRALDSGAHGIMVPMCETKEQAEVIARAAHYRTASFPTGNRGAGGIMAPANFHTDYPEYIRRANTSITVIVQIETPLGVQNAEAIASVPGIDLLFIGPNDLCQSMGFFGPDHRTNDKVQAAVQTVLDAAKRQGKHGGYFCMSADEAAGRVKQGWTLVNCGADITAIASWMSAEMSKLKQLVEGA